MIIGNPLLLKQAADSTPADPVTRSLRFDGTSYLSRITGSTSTTWTISMWFKRGTLAQSDNQYLAAWNTSEGVGFRGTGDSGNVDKLSLYDGSGHNRSAGVYRDPSAWAHICVSVNSGTGTVYYNGESIISGVSGIGAWGTLRIGDWASGTTNAEYFGIIADVYGIEGSALDHTSFTESNDYGGLKPIAYTGSFGTNGFHLEFEDYGDHSFIGLDSSLGGAINWDTSKKRSGYTSPSWSESNTQFDGANGVVQHTMSNFAGSGKYYAEFEFTSGSYSGSSVSGVGPVPEDWWTGSTLNSYMWSGTDAARKGCAMIAEEKIKSPTGSDIDCSNTGSEPHFTVGTDRIGIEVDGTANTAVFYRVNSSEKVEIASLNNTDDGIDFGGKVAWGCTSHDGAHSIRGYFTSASWLQSPSSGFAAMPSGNHFTATGLSSHDVMLDVPTKNYATINPLNGEDSSHAEYGEGNLHITYNNSGQATTFGATMAFPKTGQWYAEVYIKSYGSSDSTRPKIGICRSDYDLTKYNNDTGQLDSADCFHYQKGGNKGGNSAGSSSYGASHTTGDIIGVAFDSDNGTLTFYKNGTSQGQAFSGLTKEYILATSGYDTSNSGTDDSVILNFGQDPTFAGNYTETPDSAEWAHSPPAGFKSLNTSNLDAPSVTPSEHFSAAIYEGNDGDEEINLGFTPDLTWIKNRDDNDTYHGLYDSVRGLSAGAIHIQETGAEEGVQRVASFDSDTGSEGFTLASTDFTFTNASGKDYISWNWKAHQTPSASYSYNNTLTLEVEVYDQGYGSFSGWGTTKLEVIEGSTSLGFVSEPTTYDNDYGGYYVQYSIKTDDVSKIKLVWRTVDSDSDVFYDIYAYLENSSSTELASWDGSNYSGGGGEGPDAPETDDVFYPSSGHDSTNASTTGVLEVQATSSVEDNSEKYNSAAGFTMFTYTGNSSNDNDMMLFNHSLGVPIDFAIGKCRSTPSASGGKWVVWHKNLVNDDGSLYLNESESESNTNGNNYDEDSSTIGWFQNVTSGAQHQVKIRNVLIYDGSNTDTVRMVDNSKNFVFYGFAGVEGYSKFGSYTGNLDADGPFIYTGFRPAFVMIKNIDNSSVHWNIHDSARDTHNLTENRLSPNNGNDEDTGWDEFDFLSNGFKARAADTGNNGNGNTIIYAAFAESPFKHANAR